MTREGTRVVLDALSLRDFRTSRDSISASPGEGAVVVGENGQGKSNLLEAIYYLHLLRSVRGARDVDVVRFGARGSTSRPPRPAAPTTSSPPGSSARVGASASSSTAASPRA
jgi:DNA replication and repair protein RecF